MYIRLTSVCSRNISTTLWPRGYRVGLLKYARSSLCSKKVGNRKNWPHVMKSNFWFCIWLHGSFFIFLMYLLKRIFFLNSPQKNLKIHTGPILWKFKISRLHSLLVLGLNCVKLVLFFWKSEFSKNTYYIRKFSKFESWCENFFLVRYLNDGSYGAWKVLSQRSYFKHKLRKCIWKFF